MDMHETEAICERCIWHHDWQGLLRTGPCHPNSWAGSVRAELAAHGIDPDLPAVPGPCPAFPYCAVVMMVKNEADILRANLDWLVHIGVRRFVVMDNNSDDSTWDELMRFQAEQSDARLVALRDPVLSYYQAQKTSGMCRVAHDSWPEIRWVLPIDADEFLVAPHGVRALAYVPDHVQALTIPKVVQFYPAAAAPPEGPVQLGAMSVRSHLFAVPPKIALRARAGLGVTQGNHKATSPAGETISYAGGFTYGFYYREFQTRSFAQFLSKVRHGGAAILAARAEGNDVGGEHWLQWHAILTEGGEAALARCFREVAFRDIGPGYVADPFLGTPGPIA
jgi:hypothetical protein